MIAYYLKTIVRQFAKSKTFLLVNLTGLVSGITVCLFVAQFVWFEWSFERFNVNADRTYRVNLYNTSYGVFEGIYSGTVSGLAYEMKQALSGVEIVARIKPKMKGVVANAGRKIENLEHEIVYGDPAILKLLGVQMINGGEANILRDPQSVAISRSMAIKYFGTTEVVGENLEIGTDGIASVIPYQVQAVFEDIPLNSHQHFHFVLPPKDEKAWDDNWAWSNVTTYVQLQAGVNPTDLDEPLSKIVKQFHQDNTGDQYLLEPITSIRLHALDGSGRATLVGLFIVLGVVILLLASFNYVSLSTARFLEKMKEVGVRKLVGASRKQLIAQHLTEAFFFNVISFACAVIMFVVTWPMLANYLQIPLSETFLSEPLAYGLLVISASINAIFSGLYPSLFLSSFTPLQSIKGEINRMTDRATVRKALVVVQLSISVILIAAIFAVNQQVLFMQKQNLGISLEQTLVIEEPILRGTSIVQDFESFKNDILQIPAVHGITHASSFPGSEIDWHRTDIKLGSEDADYRYDSRIISIGSDFLDLFELKLIAGRNFYRDVTLEGQTMLINEQACNMFGFNRREDALGKVIFIGSRRFEIIGVVNDYHFRSLQFQMEPLLFMRGSGNNSNHAVRIAMDNIPQTISKIESLWKKAHPGNIFSYYFLDDKFEAQYTNDQRIGDVISGFTLLAIVISCLGILGLSLYSVGRRMKEICIRKVMGASSINMIVLLSRDFFKLVAIAAILGVPLIYFGLDRWLAGYAYRMPLSFSIFLLPLALITLLTFVTISFQTVKASRTNPVNGIKND